MRELLPVLNEGDVQLNVPVLITCPALRVRLLLKVPPLNWTWLVIVPPLHVNGPARTSGPTPSQSAASDDDYALRISVDSG